MTQLNQPAGEAELGGNGVYGAGIGANLEGVDEAIDEADDGDGVALPERKGGKIQLLPVLDNDYEECERGFEGMREGSDGFPGGYLQMCGCLASWQRARKEELTLLIARTLASMSFSSVYMQAQT